MAPYDQKRKNGKVSHYLSTYVQYVEDFRFFDYWVNVAGRSHRHPEKEISKCFVTGLEPESFREEMYSRTFENSDDVIREAREELSTYRDILEVSDHVKIYEPKKEFGKEKRDHPESVETFPKKYEAKSIVGRTFSPYKKSGTLFGAKDDLKDVECYKLGPKIQRGHSSYENGRGEH